VIRAVIDTNVLVSGLLSPSGNEALILLAIHQGLLHPCFSQDILEEYAAVLARPKFAFPPGEIAAVLAMFRGQGELSGRTFQQPSRPIRPTPSSCNAQKPPRQTTSLLATSGISPTHPTALRAS
jgi:hypothetical protein